MKKVDIHVHLVKKPIPICFSAEERIAYDQMMGIEKCVLLPTVPAPSAAGEAQDPVSAMWDDATLRSMDACSVCQTYPDHFAWMCNVFLDGTDAPYEELKRYKALGACGVGEFAQSLRFDDPLMTRLFGWCQELDMPFLFHMSPDGKTYGVVDLPGLPLLEGALKRFPRLKFIGHSQPFWFEMSQYPAGLTNAERNVYPAGRVVPGRVPQLLAQYDNLYGDLSADSGGNAILRDPDYGVEFLTRFQDKLLYGSDMILHDQHYPLGCYLDSLVRQSKLDKQAYEKICRLNAGRVFGI